MNTSTPKTDRFIKVTKVRHFEGQLTIDHVEQLVMELGKIKEERARVRHLIERVSRTYLSVSQLAELLDTFELEVARLETIEHLASRLIEGEGEDERHVLLDLFEDPSNRARAVDLLGWH